METNTRHSKEKDLLNTNPKQDTINDDHKQPDLYDLVDDVIGTNVEKLSTFSIDFYVEFNEKEEKESYLKQFPQIDSNPDPMNPRSTGHQHTIQANDTNKDWKVTVDADTEGGKKKDTLVTPSITKLFDNTIV